MNYNTSPIYEARRNALGEIAEINRNHPHLSLPAKRKMNPNSNNSIHDVKRHPITREVIKRKMVRRVKFV